ncbi:MAG: GDP-mannose 4,6-dehydratase [Deltaproteobacteria bacterium]|nr:GDP-mannose 4,6-dehydratase [Deltaproteobacteria bacterium]MBW1910695.1 GDP-mannose 4,6-dehydratase [Deltaproteobacteria bacterium]MBW2034770.1 GDP-mannose 4,6-dehydratase [Deltaproteobacteria bacterium]MBW2115164.1 GDP-mannose 4,6-dehydratase [Deltaproteobacteria bacterium]MBW2169527.1 GDP-mannose 4,6-dehydratase [Deltaproteobacteria bacterium]
MAGKNQIIMVTGAAGFIGFHLSKTLLDMGESVIGVDNLNNYYDVSLKRSRLDILKSLKNFVFYKEEIQNFKALEKIFKQHRVDLICNLAAQAGVRYSLIDPFSYQKSNLEGFLNLLELARKYGITNFVYASSSSVYGTNKKIPFSVEDRVDTPISLYGATKRANELIAHAYSHIYQIPCTGLRYFTVYGPWGRPDMALFIFTDAILKKRPINVFNHGRMRRDFTYIDDIVDGTIAALERPAPYEIFNLGNSNSVGLLEFISTLEEELGQEAEKKLMPMQPGDVADTAADITKSRKLLGFDPKTPIREGIRKFVAWYRDYYDL